MKQKGKRLVYNMNTENIISLQDKIERKLTEVTCLYSGIDEVIINNKKDLQITENSRIIIHSIDDNLELALKEIKRGQVEIGGIDIDTLTLPLCMAVELSEALITLLNHFDSGKHILSKNKKAIKQFAKELKLLYTIDLDNLLKSDIEHESEIEALISQYSNCNIIAK